MESPVPPKVVVATDDPQLGQMMKSSLSAFGLLVVGMAKSGVAAFGLFQKVRPEALVLDLKMPVQDGLTTLEQVRKVDSTCLILMITSGHEENERRRATALGANGFLVKPLHAHSLFKDLRRLFRVLLDRGNAPEASPAEPESRPPAVGAPVQAPEEPALEDASSGPLPATSAGGAGVAPTLAAGSVGGGPLAETLARPGEDRADHALPGTDRSVGVSTVRSDLAFDPTIDVRLPAGGDAGARPDPTPALRHSDPDVSRETLQELRRQNVLLEEQLADQRQLLRQTCEQMIGLLNELLRRLP